MRVHVRALRVETRYAARRFVRIACAESAEAYWLIAFGGDPDAWLRILDEVAEPWAVEDRDFLVWLKQEARADTGLLPRIGRAISRHDGVLEDLPQRLAS